MQLWFVATGTGVRQPALSMQHPFDQKSDGESRRGLRAIFPYLLLQHLDTFCLRDRKGTSPVKPALVYRGSLLEDLTQHEYWVIP